MRLRTWAVVIFLCPVWGVLLSGQTRSDRFEIGEQYSFFSNQHSPFGGQHLLGGRLDIRLSHHLWLSSQLEAGVGNYLPPDVTSADGGRLLLGCFGLKAGSRHKRFGVFGDVRGGFASWSSAIQNIVWGSSISFGRLTEPLLNVGGTFEVYTHRNAGFRISVGDSITFYSSSSVVAGEAPLPAFRTKSVHISTGVFYRF